MSKNLEIPQFSSCIAQEPFIKYGSGPATEIMPNLPQTNEFSAYGVLPVEVSPSAFKTGENPPPVDPFFAEIAALKVGTPLPTADEVKAKIATKLRGMFGTHIKPKNFPVSGTEKIVDPAWVTAANYSVPVQYIYVQKMIDNFVDYMGDMPFSEVVDKVNTEGVKPVVSLNYAQQALVAFVKPITTTTPAVPNLFVVEEYRMAAYLGKYGMGRVVKTFTLLPGEKTTITVKTYKDTKTTKSRSENVLDSYSESSANDLENLVQGEQENKMENKKSTDFTGKLSFTGGSKFLSGVQASAELTTKNESTRGSLVKNLNRALEKHVNNSNSNRQIQVNTTTTETTTDTEENATVRELLNLNKSRVLNFVFRQLHQQYITVTYLSDIKIAFSNGFEPDARLVSLEDLRSLLTSVLNPESIDEVERNILKNYCVVYDYTDNPVAFIENKTFYLGTCAGVVENDLSAKPSSKAKVKSSKTSAEMEEEEPVPAEHGGIVRFWRKKKDVKGTIPKKDYGLEMTVPGVILSITESTLKTSSTLTEAMLGQADALDCFNLKIQDAEAQKGYIDNTERLTRLQNEEWKARHDRAKQQQEIDRMKTDNELVKLQMEIIREIKDPVQRAEMYKKIFGTCCDTPQTVINH